MRFTDKAAQVSWHPELQTYRACLKVYMALKLISETSVAAIK